MNERTNRWLGAAMHEALTGLRSVTNAMFSDSARAGRSHVLDAKRELRGALDSLVRAEAEADREVSQKVGGGVNDGNELLLETER